MEIDFIGDIHGHADKLEELLQKLDYKKHNGLYTHESRKVLFVGDYIDRGPKIRETLKIVKAMADSGNAIALLGNHEYNALCFHFKNPEGAHLREHSEKNIRQHEVTLNQFANHKEEWEMYLNWFLTLPLYYETNEFRAVHACWDTENIEVLRNQLHQDMLTQQLLLKMADKKSVGYHALDETLKGKEIKLPAGQFFTDKDQPRRSDIRIKWWEDPQKMTYQSVCVHPVPDLLETPIKTSDLSSLSYYSEKEKPVFFGHYWLIGQPTIFRHNICCLDYSIAKEGKLVAYRFDGEQELEEGKIVWV